MFKSSATVQKNDRLVISVARIEELKNQLNVIRALNGTKYRLLLIGSPAPGQLSYYRLCRKTVKNNVRFINHIPQQELVQYFLKYAEKLAVRYTDFHIADSVVIKQYLDLKYDINCKYSSLRRRDQL